MEHRQEQGSEAKVVDDKIVAPSGLELKIPDNAMGYVGEEGNFNEDGESLEDVAQRDIERREKNKNSKETSDETSKESNTELLEKFRNDQESLTDEELNILQEAGLIETDDSESDTDDTGNDDLSLEEINAKLQELSDKDISNLTEEEIAFLENHREEEPLINTVKNSIKENYGIEIEDDLSNDIDGLLKVIDTASTKRGQQVFSEAINSNPILSKFYQHTVVEGKSPETFTLQQSKAPYAEVELSEPTKEDNELQRISKIDQMKSIIRMDYNNKGLDSDTVEEMLNTFEDGGKLLDKAKLAQASLNESHKVKIQEELLKEDAKIKAEQKAIEEEWNAVQETIKNNNFIKGSFKIPQSDLPQFSKAMLEVIDEHGNTKMDYIRHKASIEERVLSDYMLYSKFNTDLIKKTDNKRRALSFKESKNKNKQTRKGNRIIDINRSNSKTNAQSLDITGINFNQIKTN